MNKIDFNKTKPDFINDDFRWYIDRNFQEYIEKEQANNLPKLNNLYCFIVKGRDFEDYVLIDNNRNVIAGYTYNMEGYGQMEAKINILKILKHYEKVNV